MSSSLGLSCRRCSIALLVALLPGVALAQPARRGLPAPERTTLPDRPVELTMHRFNRLPVVEARVNGQGPYRLIVDTGAAGVLLDSAIAEDLDLPAPPGMPAGVSVQVRSPGGPVHATLAYIGDLALGDATFGGIWTIVTELPFGDGMDGVIGLNVFKSCLLTYDYPSDRVILSSGSLPEADGDEIITYTTPRSPDSHPMITIDAAGEDVDCMIDTGMRGWFGLGPDQVKELAMLEGPVAGTMGLSVGGARRQQVARLDSVFRIGGHVVEKPIARVFEDRDGYILGTLFLEQFAVTFDPAHHRLRLARESNGPITPPARRELGLELKRRGERVEVWDVHPDSHAAELGIVAGDAVLTVEGTPAGQVFDTARWYDWLRDKQTLRVRYEPASGKGVRDVEVRVMTLLK